MQRRVYFCGGRSARQLRLGLDDPALERAADFRLERSVEDVGVEIDSARPFDRAGLLVDPDLREDVVVVADCSEELPVREYRRQFDLLHHAIAEPQPDPPVVQRRRGGDAARAGHGSGSMRFSGAGSLANRQLSTPAYCAWK